MDHAAVLLRLMRALAAIVAVAAALAIVKLSSADAAPSVCFGTPEGGRLTGAARLPARGANFTSYSLLGSALGRTYVHDNVRAVILDAYDTLASVSPRTAFVYGETGFPGGGPFKPHKTHQNGTSVDFMVPVRRDGASVPLPTSAFNKFGYALEFDSRGRSGDLSIDFEAIALHLLALSDSGARRGVKIRRVIFDVPLQQKLFDAQSGSKVRERITFSQRSAWVRHDEHYHVDFEIPCKPLN